MLETHHARHVPPPGKGDAKVIVVMPARNAARTLERTVSRSRVMGRRDHPRRRQVDRRHRRARPRAADPRRLASAQRRLRRQPEDVLPRGAAARRRRGRDAAPRRPVRADADPGARRADRAGEADMVLGSRMAEPGTAREGGMPLYKRVANRGLTAIENRLMGTELSELHTGYRAFSAPCARRCRSCATRWTSLRHGDAHAGGRTSASASPRCPCASRYIDDASSVSVGPATSTASRRSAGARLVLHRRGIWGRGSSRREARLRLLRVQPRAEPRVPRRRDRPRPPARRPRHRARLRRRARRAHGRPRRRVRSRAAGASPA